MTDRPLVFISYSERDEAWKERLVTHLRLLERQGMVNLWSRALARSEAVATLSREQALREARAAMVLITRAYHDDQALWKEEARAILERRHEEALLVFPVLVQRCDWQAVPWPSWSPRDPRDGRVRSLEDSDPNEQEVYLTTVVRKMHEALFNPSMSVEPRYADPELRHRFERLDEARARQRALKEAKVDTALVDAEIRELSRELRQGGQLRAGDSLGDGRYLLIEPAGRGGFATVWKARDRATDELCAIKVLHAELAGDRTRRERFLRGARRMADLGGEGAVRVLVPHGEDDGFHYFVMEHVPGGDLRQAVLEKRLSQADVLPILLRVGEVLARAHSMGFVHRDVKPANILLDASGAPRLSDFDLVAEGADSTGGTRTNTALGTIGYAAPELLLNAKSAGPAADIYGLAMTAVFCLRGEELRELVLGHTPRAIIEDLACSAKLKAVLTRAVAPKPSDRYENMTAFCGALSGTKPKPSPLKTESASWTLPMKWIRYGVVGALALAATGLAYCAGHPGTPATTETVTPQRPTSTAPAVTTLPPSASTSALPPPPPKPPSLPASKGHIALVKEAPMPFVKLPGGIFIMGSPPKEEGRSFTERQHVYNVEPLEISAYEVTQKQWTTVMKTKPFDCAYGCGDDFPAQNVSWVDAVRFMNALSIREKKTPCYQESDTRWIWDQRCTGYRLPAEAEWEYAVRAGTETSYSFGDNVKDLCAHANANAHDGCDDGYSKLAPVGKFKPNPWGLYDMHGNVWEWVWDWFEPRWEPKDVNDRWPETGDTRGFRGGSFEDDPNALRSAARRGIRPEATIQDGGFRCVRGSPRAGP